MLWRAVRSSRSLSAALIWSGLSDNAALPCVALWRAVACCHAVACCASLQIIECSFDMERKVWTFMRDRPDKDTANHRSVFDKVMTSIVDNITVRMGMYVCVPIMCQQWQLQWHPRLG